MVHRNHRTIKSHESRNVWDPVGTNYFRLLVQGPSDSERPYTHYDWVTYENTQKSTKNTEAVTKNVSEALACHEVCPGGPAETGSDPLGELCKVKTGSLLYFMFRILFV